LRAGATSPRRWREQFLAGGAEKLAGKTERAELEELRRENDRLARTLGRKTIPQRSAREKVL